MGVILGMALCLVMTGACVSTSGDTTPTTTPPRTAAEACLAALSSGAWQVAAEMDRAAASVLALTQDSSIATCTTVHANASFGPTLVGVGAFPLPAGSRLTYLTGVSDPNSGDPTVLVGRMPPGTASVTLFFRDGSTVPATLGTGVWLAWLETSDTPVGIEALDAEGAVVGRVQNSNGVQPQG
jgi:hypothetical protein